MMKSRKGQASLQQIICGAQAVAFTVYGNDAYFCIVVQPQLTAQLAQMHLQAAAGIFQFAAGP